MSGRRRLGIGVLALAGILILRFLPSYFAAPIEAPAESGAVVSGSPEVEEPGPGEVAWDAIPSPLVDRFRAAGAPSPVAVEQSGPPVVEVLVVHEDSGEPVPGAVVLFSAAGYDGDQLEPAEQQESTRSLEHFLLRRGEQRQAGPDGLVEIPLAAAHLPVVGRHGELYGSSVQRHEDTVWTLPLKPHGTLCVEVVDAQQRPAPGIRIMAQDLEPLQGMRRSFLMGTTDEVGRLNHLFALAPPGPAPRTLSVYASLPAGRCGDFSLDCSQPPSQPVRITLPPTGSVIIRVLDSAGQPLDPRRLSDPDLWMRVVEPTPPEPTLAELVGAGRQVARIGDDGRAQFSHVALGRRLTVWNTSLLAEPMEFEGPRDEVREVVIQHEMHRDHPRVAGRLVDPDGQGMPDACIMILARSGPDLQSLVAGHCDERGNFEAYLSAGALGAVPSSITFSVDWEGAGPKRSVELPLRTPLLGRIWLGDVVIPAASSSPREEGSR